MDTASVDEAMVLLRRAVAATEEALGVTSSLDQLQERFEGIVVPLIEEPDVWLATTKSLQEAKQALFHARGCLDEMLSQVARGQGQETQARAWADQFVKLNEDLQSALANASQQATQFYESMRPALIAHYLEHSTKVPRWADTWPRDAEIAARVLPSIADGRAEFGVEELDIQLARFRWEVGWPQQRIASVVGLSQPSVAARLSRMDGLISFQVGAELVQAQVDREGAKVVRWHLLGGRGSRGPENELVVEASGCIAQFELLVASGETGTGRRTGTAGRGMSLDYLRLEFADRRQRSAERTVNGIAVYFRDRGVVGYYTAAEMVDALRRFGNLPAEAILQQLREVLEPAWTIGDFIQRAERSTQNPDA